MEKKEALQALFTSAELYHRNFENRNLLIIGASSSLNSISAMEASFRDVNFLHLTGVRLEAKRRLSAGRFFALCLQKRLSPHDFQFAGNGTTEQKLSILPTLFASGNLSANMLGDYHDRRPALITDKLVGNIRCCIGFVYNDGLHTYVPNTVLNTDMRDSIQNKQRILAIYRKPRSEVRYSELIYQAKKIDWSRVRLPAAYSYLPLPRGD